MPRVALLLPYETFLREITVEVTEATRSLLTAKSMTGTLAAMNARRRNLDPRTTRDEILAHAAHVAVEIGLHNLTIAAVARRADRAASLVSAHFSIAELKKALMREAIKRGHADVIAEGLAVRDAIASKAPDALLEEARKILASR